MVKTLFDKEELCPKVTCLKIWNKDLLEENRKMETCTNTSEHLLSHKWCPPLNRLARNIQPSGISSWQRKKISLVTISHKLAK